MIYLSCRYGRENNKEVDFDGNWPYVTVQLPIYNEKNVAKRIIYAAASFDYPRKKLEIQVLDDSNDETICMVNDTIEELRSKGIDIKAIRRSNRAGFKAGALEHGTKLAKGEFLAVFDADFIPTPDFLINTIPEFYHHKKIAFVQTRWGHLNRGDSILTRCQALGIDGHFLVEQPARSSSGLFMNFNGTAGVWRRKAIEDAGGWSHATLTEDLDLSYRVQLAGWIPYYLKDVVAPAEIPTTITAIKSQQFRWAKGSIQTAIIMIPKVWRGQYTYLQKAQAFLHLTNYAVHPMMMILAILALPILKYNLVKMSPLVFGLAVIPLAAATFGPSTMYIVAAARKSGLRIRSVLWLPALVIYGTGIAISNSVAVFEAIAGKTSSFIRTPKKGDHVRSGYRLSKNKLWVFEIGLGLYSIGSISASITSGNYGILPFLFIFTLGFLTVGIKTAFGITRDA